MAINIYFVSEIHSLQNKHSCQEKLFRTLRTNGSKLTRNYLICSDGEVWQTHQHRIILCKQKQVDIALSWERNISEVWGNFLIQLRDYNNSTFMWLWEKVQSPDQLCNTRPTIIWSESLRVVEVECPVLDLYFVKKWYDVNKEMIMI